MMQEEVTETVVLRPAAAGDLDALLAIYAPYVQYTTVSSEYDPPTPAEFARRMERYTQTLPWLVCELGGVPVGYGYASPHRTRAGYQWSVETSIYVHPAFHHRGIARAIYSALFELLRLQGYYNIFIGVTAPNADSIRFHKAMGFVWSGVYAKSMYKFGQWHDVFWMHKSLRGHQESPPPTPATPFPQLQTEQGEAVREILHRWAATVRPGRQKEEPQ